MSIIIDLTFKVKRKQNFYVEITYIVKVSFFNVSVSINRFLTFNFDFDFVQLKLRSKDTVH